MWILYSIGWSISVWIIYFWCEHVQPRCDRTTWVWTKLHVWTRQSGVIHFLWYPSHSFGMSTQIRYDRTLFVWHKVYGVNHNEWCEQNVYGVMRKSYGVINNLQFDHTWWTQNIFPVGVIKHPMMWSQICVEINYVHTINGAMAPPFGVIETSVWCDHFKCFSLMQTHKHHAQHHAASDGVSTAV